jgi:hypothetical protein
MPTDCSDFSFIRYLRGKEEFILLIERNSIKAGVGVLATEGGGHLASKVDQ